MKTNITKKTVNKATSLAGKIVIIGFNDCVTNGKNLTAILAGKWRKGGPEIPLEFTRISTSGHLTPVIDLVAPATKTMFAVAKSKSLKAVAMEVAKREGIAKYMDRVGFISLKDLSANARSLEKHPQVCAAIADWAAKHKIAGVVWQSLGRKFKKKVGAAFSNQAALQYLNSLNPVNRAKAVRYLRACPITTPFKTFLLQNVL